MDSKSKKILEGFIKGTEVSWKNIIEDIPKEDNIYVFISYWSEFSIKSKFRKIVENQIIKLVNNENSVDELIACYTYKNTIPDSKLTKIFGNKITKLIKEEEDFFRIMEYLQSVNNDIKLAKIFTTRIVELLDKNDNINYLLSNVKCCINNYRPHYRVKQIITERVAKFLDKIDPNEPSNWFVEFLAKDDSKTYFLKNVFLKKACFLLRKS